MTDLRLAIYVRYRCVTIASGAYPLLWQGITVRSAYVVVVCGLNLNRSVRWAVTENVKSHSAASLLRVSSRGRIATIRFRDGKRIFFPSGLQWY